MASKRSWRERLSGVFSSAKPSSYEESGVAEPTSASLSEAPLLREAPSGRGGGGRDPSETLVKKVGLALDVGQSREYQAPDFDLAAITEAYDTEAYVRQAFDKYIEMMFKSGWDITGKNQDAVDYIRLRLKLIAEMTEIPTDQLLIEIAEDLVKYSNVFVVKARDTQGLLAGSQTGLNVQGLGDQEPVAGYFPVNATTMAVLRDRNGTIRGWQQSVEGEDRPVNFKATDVVHFYYKREKGRAYGTPFLLAVINDIRALRQMEETVLRMVYRNLHPLQHVQVGSKELPGQSSEVDNVRDEYEGMELEAAFVTSERVKLNAISSDTVIDAEKYLQYFERRVFTGLGVSEMLMGRGATASRSTGDTLSAEFGDRVKAFQKVFALFFDSHIIYELLMEGGYDPILNPDDDVDFVFKEIDVDAKIKAENHAVYLYEHNAITESEMRAMIGRDPITDRAEMFMNVVSIPTATAKSAGSEEEGTPDTNNRNAPKNQHSEEGTGSVATPYEDRYIHAIEQVMDRGNARINEQIEAYAQSANQSTLQAVAGIVRETEEELFQTMEHHLGKDYAKPYARHLNRLCRQLHEGVVEAATTMSGDEKLARMYEMIGGIQEVQLMRLRDIGEAAYRAYQKPPVDPTNEGVE